MWFWAVFQMFGNATYQASRELLRGRAQFRVALDVESALPSPSGKAAG
jgi:hypothetical protein